jgi:hypothetical protein
MDALAEQVKKRGLDLSFCFVGHQDRELLRHSLGVPDLHWLSLRPALEALIVASKFYGIAAASRPTLAITAPDGEIADLVRRHQCGLSIAPGCVNEFGGGNPALVEMSGRARCDGSKCPCHDRGPVRPHACFPALARGARSNQSRCYP